jgi:hypothetical protein
MADINSLYDQIPPHLAKLPRVCPRLDCPSPTNVELKYFNNRSVARCTQPRFWCHGCKQHFTLGGQLRKANKHVVQNTTNNKTSRPKHTNGGELLIDRSMTPKLKDKIVETSSKLNKKRIRDEENVEAFRTSTYNEKELLKCKIKSHFFKAQITLLDIDLYRQAKELELSSKSMKASQNISKRRKDNTQDIIQNLSDVLIQHVQATSSSTNISNFFQTIGYQEDMDEEYQIIEKLLTQLEQLDYEAFTSEEMNRIVEVAEYVSTRVENE